MAKTIHPILTFVIVLLGLFTSPISASQTARACFFPSIMAEDGVCYQSEGEQPISVKILKKGAVERVGQKCVSTRKESWSLHETTTCTWQQTITGSDEGSPPLVGAGGNETRTLIIAERALVLLGIFLMVISLLFSLLGNSNYSAGLALFAALFAFIPLLNSTTDIWGLALSAGSVLSAIVVASSSDYKKSIYLREKTYFFSFGILYSLMAPVAYWLR